MSQSQVPKVVRQYFTRYFPGWVGDRRDHPIIFQTFVPGRGWRNYPGTKRVSVSWLRKLKGEGVTVVGLSTPTDLNDRIVDFPIGEICRGESRSYPCGVCA